MKFRIFDTILLTAIVALMYVQAMEGQQHRSNHYFLRGRITAVEAGMREREVRQIDTNKRLWRQVQDLHRTASACDYVCQECGWKPRDDGAMNREDTCEPLVAITRIDAHECKEASQ